MSFDLNDLKYGFAKLFEKSLKYEPESSPFWLVPSTLDFRKKALA